MKGYIIFENFNKLIECKEILDGGYTCVISDYPNGEFSGVINRVTGARCNSDDTYDFETGAIIALMKMCGVEKVTKACDELYKDDNYKNALQEMTENNEKLIKENEKLKHEYDLCKNSENALKCSVDYLNKTIAKLNTAIYGYKEDLYKVTKRCTELEAKESILNKQEETINKREEELSVYFGGRKNGKQYTALVNLFKKIDQKKIDAAYKEAYNTNLPVWQKEVLNQMYGIYKESKEKIELPRTLDINGTVYRKSIQVKDFGEQINKLTVDSLIEQSRAFTRKCVDERLYKPPTKREEMWEKIFALHKESDVIIKVKREDINTFLHEIENKIPEITWASGDKIFETKYTIGDIYGALKTCDMICFRLWRANELSYSSNPDIYLYKDLHRIDYLSPMRWDLFKKGRLAVKVTYENYKGFYDACEKELGKKPATIYCGDFTVSICKKDGKFEIFDIKDQDKKIVNWEDVR